MEWLEVNVAVENEVAEAVAEAFSRYAHRGVVIEAGPDGWNAGPVVVKAYLSTDDQLWVKKRDIREALWHLSQIQPIPEPSFRLIAEEDWTEAWKRQLDVLRIGRHVVVCPSWLDHASDPEDIVVQLDPGMAFGTGLHPTTQMCLIALEELIQPGMDVLDMGTGSGILAIAAAKLGASVMAVDNDPQAVKVARSNVIENGMRESVAVKRGSLPQASGGYDLVVINILAKVIVDMVQEGLSERMRPEGVVITAGVTDDQAPDVITAFERGGFTLIGRRQRGDWVSLLAKQA